MPSVLMPAMRLKTNVNMNTVNKGAKNNHKGPRMVCLYTDTMSRRMKRLIRNL